MLLRDLITGLDARLLTPDATPGEADLRVTDITEDSRTVMPGSLFVARKGEKSDGKAFVPQAIAAGAAALLVDDPAFTLDPALPAAKRPVVITAADPALLTAQIAERFYGSPSSKMSVIGVTGTNGKTTTTFLIHQMLNSLGIRCGLVGTVEIDDGVETAPASLTTPPALELSRTFARMVEAGCKAAAIEVSSHSLHQHRVGGVAFRAGVFTNLTQDHLDYHKTMEHYADAKAMLFQKLTEGDVAIVNVQDPWHSHIVKGCKARLTRCMVDEPGALSVTGGTAPDTVLRARVLSRDPGGTDVELAGFAFPTGPRRIRLPLAGSFNVFNALDAIASVLGVFGEERWGGSGELSVDDVLDAAAKVAPPPGRLEPVTTPDCPISVFVDYAHTDDALKTVLDVLRGSMSDARTAIRGGRLVCVFGCGGDRDATKRPKMGKVAGELADRVVITSDNPRTEDPGTIIAMVRAGIGPQREGKVSVEPDRERAIREAVASAEPGDVVVIAGKGHENYQIMPDPVRPGKTVTRPFDDREIARSALQERGIQPRERAAERRGPVGSRR